MQNRKRDTDVQNRILDLLTFYLLLGNKYSWAFLVAQTVKNPHVNAGDPGSIPRSGRSPEKGMETHSCILAWRIPWTEETGGLQSAGLQRVRHGWVTTLSFSTNIHLGRCSAFVCPDMQFVMYSIRSKNSHLLKWGLVWNLHDPQKKPCVRCDQRTFTVTLWEALWGLMSVWGNRSLVLQCGRSQRVERDCLCLNCYQKKLPSLKHW